MHALYDAVTLVDLPWGLRTADDLFVACAKCEIKIVVGSVAARKALVNALVYSQTSGRILKKSAAGFPQLQIGDRLEPSEHLRDTGALEGVAVGTTVIFWRRAMVGDRSSSSSLSVV